MALVRLDIGGTVRATPCPKVHIPVDLERVDKFEKFWMIELYGKTWWAGRGHPDAPKQVVVWYPNHRMNLGYGLSVRAALNGAISDAWKYI